VVEVVQREGVFYGVDVGSGTHRGTARWRTDAPLSLPITAYVAADSLRDFRRRLRAWSAPVLARPSLVLRALIAEAREVGSCLSALDHGAGREAWDRIHRAGATARALLSLVDPDSAGRFEAFAANPQSAWSTLTALAESETATRPTSALDAYADACVVGHLIAADATRDAAAALAGAALATLPGGTPEPVHEALRKAREAH